MLSIRQESFTFAELLPFLLLLGSLLLHSTTTTSTTTVLPLFVALSRAAEPNEMGVQSVLTLSADIEGGTTTTTVPPEDVINRYQSEFRWWGRTIRRRQRHGLNYHLADIAGPVSNVWRINDAEEEVGHNGQNNKAVDGETEDAEDIQELLNNEVAVNSELSAIRIEESREGEDEVDEDKNEEEEASNDVIETMHLPESNAVLVVVIANKWKRHLIAGPSFDNCPTGQRLVRNECRDVLFVD